MIYQSILDTVGNTPVVKLNRIFSGKATIYLKLESFNPMGSVKDRMAKAIIEDAEARGELKPGQTVIEATSGNTGIGLAMVCAAKGYPFVAVMPDSFSLERRKIMKALGAKLVLTPAAEKATGMVIKAKQLAEEHGWFETRQFDNPANPECHKRTTGPEIIRDFASIGLDALVCGWGTGGTISGTAKAVKEAMPDTRIVTCEPQTAALAKGDPWQPHKIQGIVPNFYPNNFNLDVIDHSETVTDEEAKAMARKLANLEGIFVGLSAGAAVAGAVKLARQGDYSGNILALAPDTGERYLSTYLFDDITDESDEAELFSRAMLSGQMAEAS